MIRKQHHKRPSIKNLEWDTKFPTPLKYFKPLFYQELYLPQTYEILGQSLLYFHEDVKQTNFPILAEPEPSLNKYIQQLTYNIDIDMKNIYKIKLRGEDTNHTHQLIETHSYIEL